MLTTPLTGDLIRGALDLEQTDRGLRPHRLPGCARAQIPDDQLRVAEAQPSGVRLVLRTAATVIELDVLPTKQAYVGSPPRPDGVYDLVIGGRLEQQSSLGDGNVRLIDMAAGTVELQPGPVGTIRFDGLPDTEKDVEIWLPHNELTELVGLRSDAPIEAVPASDRRVWVHHGSSISHGSNADHPTGTWPAVAAALGGVELVNLGYGGSAVLDPFVARTIRDLPADVISLKLGINLVNADLMRLRAFAPAVHGFLDTIRDGHPTTPVVLVSPILCPIHEDVPGPTALDFTELAAGRLIFQATGDAADPTRLTLRMIREQLAAIVVARADPHLTYLDGLGLYGEADVEALPLPDGLHPDAATHRLMGERFARLVLNP